MFTSISWVDYLVVVALLLSVYYLIMGVYFYSRDLRLFFAGLQKTGIRAGPEAKPSNPFANQDASGFYNMEAEAFTPQDLVAQTSNDTFQEVEQLIAQLKEAIGEVQAKKYSKEEFILLLQLVLKEYPAFMGSSFESAIQEFILSESKKQDSISLTQEDILQLFTEVAARKEPDLPQNEHR
jgi:hypothetical protein